MRALILLALSVLTLAGCGGGGAPDLVPVSGTVNRKGKPVEGAIVTFIPTGETKGGEGVGRTGADGRYTLTYSQGGQGVMPGQFKVTISRRLLPGGKPVPEDYDVPDMDSPARESLPRQYSDRDVTTLTATVNKGGEPIDFNLE